MSIVNNDAANPYAGLGFNTSAPGIAAAGDNSLDQQDFLMLLTTQLKNQDPLKPLDSTQFVSQLAQFSQVSGVQEMNTSLHALTSSLKSSAVLDGAALVGRFVLLDGDTATLAADGSIVGGVTTPAGATSITVNVRNASGELVQSMQVAPTEGTTLFSWDGVQQDGTLAAPGSYRFNALASDGSRTEAATMMVADLVASVSIDPSTYALQLNTASGGPVTLAEVRQVF